MIELLEFGLLQSHFTGEETEAWGSNWVHWYLGTEMGGGAPPKAAVGCGE